MQLPGSTDTENVLFSLQRSKLNQEFKLLFGLPMKALSEGASLNFSYQGKQLKKTVEGNDSSLFLLCHHSNEHMKE